MTASVEEQILEALFTKFSGLSGFTTYRSRKAAVMLQEGTVLILQPKNTPVTRMAVTVTKRDFTIQTEILARGDIPDQVADPVRIAVHAALLADQTVGGLALSIVEEETEWEFDEADLTAVSVTARYRIIFATPANSLTTSA